MRCKTPRFLHRFLVTYVVCSIGNNCCDSLKTATKLTTVQLNEVPDLKMLDERMIFRCRQMMYMMYFRPLQSHDQSGYLYRMAAADLHFTTCKCTLPVQEPQDFGWKLGINQDLDVLSGIALKGSRREPRSCSDGCQNRTYARTTISITTTIRCSVSNFVKACVFA